MDARIISMRKEESSGHPFVSIGRCRFFARHRRRKKKNNASKTPLEDMSNVVYDVLEKKQPEVSLLDHKYSPSEIKGWASTD